MPTAIIQARMGSTRLHGKVMLNILGKPVLWHVVNRVLEAKLINGVVVATTTKLEDDIIAEFCRNNNVLVFRGSENDVLDRYYQCAKGYDIKDVVRITGDCPLLDPNVIDMIARAYLEGNYDYVTNTIEYTFPGGLDVEVFSFNAMKNACKNAKLQSEREHVTLYIRKNKEFKKKNVYSSKKYPLYRLTLDYPEDYEFIKRIYEGIGREIFYIDDVINYLGEHQELLKIRRLIMKIKAGIELWNKAKKIIPGGTQLLSKRSEMFLPEQWPSYYKKAKGVEIWDLDGNKFVDLSLMGVGACILGYADDDVNKAVKKVIDTGTMTTLNCPEEVELAELLLKLHPWADMVRYAKTGGEAMAIAVRIARAYTEKDKIAFCGYHGWHDWYLSANLADDKNLDGHLLPGLQPLGVPRGLKGTTIPFNYNRIEELEEIVKNNDIGVIVMEPIRHNEPEKDFLKNVRGIADEIGAVLIFDEISSGWRMRVGGAHELYKVYPDIAVYGKAMSNGFPMAAVVGKGEVMDVAQDSFISSTYWTDRIGPVASTTTINKMSKNNVPYHLCMIGNLISEGWRKLGKEHDLNVDIMDAVPPLTTFVFDYGEDSQALHTLFTQEMLERGFLASKSVYVSYSHNEEYVEKYLDNVDEVFDIIKETIERNNVYDLLKGPVALEGFKRLT